MEHDFFKRILDSMSDGVYFVDHDRTITYWSQGAQRISGYSPSEATGRHCSDNLLMHIDEAGELLCLGGCPLACTLRDGTPREAEVYLHHKDGHRVPVSVRVVPLHDQNGQILGAVETFCEARPRLDLELEHCANKRPVLLDPLTRLGNRNGALLDFDRKIKGLRHFRMPFGLLFMDIDGLRQVNQTHGYATGDRMLCMAAKTLTNALRGVDKVSRWGGDEFIALVTAVDSIRFNAIAERMRRLVECSGMGAPDGMTRITVSISGTMANHTDNIESLVGRALTLMERSKRQGPNRVALDC